MFSANKLQEAPELKPVLLNRSDISILGSSRFRFRSMNGVWHLICFIHCGHCLHYSFRFSTSMYWHYSSRLIWPKWSNNMPIRTTATSWLAFDRVCWLIYVHARSVYLTALVKPLLWWSFLTTFRKPTACDSWERSALTTTFLYGDETYRISPKLFWDLPWA